MPTNSQRQLLGSFLDLLTSGLNGFARRHGGVRGGTGNGVASFRGGRGGGVNGGGAGIDGGVRRSSGGVRGGVSSLASGSGGVSSGFLRGFDGFFLLGAAGEGQGGKGGGESNLRVH